MQARKKIMFLVEAMGDGVFTYIVDLANELARTCDMYIAYAVRPQTPKDYRKYFDTAVHLIEVKNFTRSINPIRDISAFSEVRKIANKVRPDIIHLHSSKAGVIGRLAFNGHKVPLFYTPHGYSFLMQNYTPAKRAIFKLVERGCAKRQCTTISCSYGEHQETLKFTKKAVYVDNGINIAELKQMLGTVEKTEHSFTVFTLGRICYQKNPRLFNSIAEAMPSVRFLWIGDGELRNELKAENIEITGWVDRAEALQFSVNADVFLLTSLWEGMPISLLESMYMKKLCVVSDVIGNRDVVRNGKNGFVCSSVEEFKKAILEADTDGTEAMITAAFNDIETRYNTSVMGAGYAEIYGRGGKIRPGAAGISEGHERMCDDGVIGEAVTT